MWQTTHRQAPFAFALSGACLFSLGIVGCAREAGLDLANQEARVDSAMTERAKGSILRSRQELAAASGTSAIIAESPETEPEESDKPSLASRWKAPFRSAGNLLKLKKDEPAEDPFLPGSDESASALADAGDRGAASDRTAPLSTAETKVALGGSQPGIDADRSKPTTSSEAQAALEEFLKSQEPVRMADRARMAAHEADSVTRKPGTSLASSSPKDSSSLAGAMSDADPGRDGLAPHDRSLATAGKARPFPPVDPQDLPDDEETLASRTVSRSSRNPLAAAPAGVRRNPLLEDVVEEEPASARSKQATGREIAGLLKKARQAGELGEIDEAMSYAQAASDLARQCSYEFTPREPTPDRVVQWLESKKSALESPDQRIHERRQIAATRRPGHDVTAMTTAYSKPNAEQVFADEPGPEVAADLDVQAPRQESAFQAWAAGVGQEQPDRHPGPNWPVLSARELAASDDLWQPSRAEFEQSWTDLRTSEVTQSDQSRRETRLASAETDAPAFVATAEAEATHPATFAMRSSDPIVQLGRPTDLAPGGSLKGGQATRRRGPRLATPPPLSIDSEPAMRASAKPRKSQVSRAAWFAIAGGASLLVLVAFRRWAYRTPTA